MKKWFMSMVMVFVCISTSVAFAEEKIDFQPTVESLKQYTVPEWFRDAKFGIFIHYGIYSVPAFGDEWYGRHMYLEDSKCWGGDKIWEHHMKVYGGPTVKGYKDFIPEFTAKNFDPLAWAKLFKKAGAKYVMPVGIHHDSFAMYDSQLTPFTAVKMGPKRDIIGDLQKAVYAQGMKFGISNHFAENNWFFTYKNKGEYNGEPFDTVDPQYSMLYSSRKITRQEHAQRWLEISKEILEKYKPDMTYFDSAISEDMYTSVKRDLAAKYYNDAQITNPDGVVLTYKGKAFEEGEALFDIERGQLDSIRPLPWQTDTSVSRKSWGYIENDVFRSSENIIASLADIVSKNGNLFLNIGPKADGTIPPEPTRILIEIGDWLAINGDAIYATRPWVISGEGATSVKASIGGDSHNNYTSKDIRFTTSKDLKYLYAIVLNKPNDQKTIITSLSKQNFDGSKIKEVQFLGGENITWTQTDEGLEIDIPNYQAITKPYAFKITFKEGVIPSLNNVTP